MKNKSNISEEYVNVCRAAFCDKIRKHREDKGLTREELAIQIGVKEKSIEAMELGKWIRFELLVRILIVLDLSIDIFPQDPKDDLYKSLIK